MLKNIKKAAHKGSWCHLKRWQTQTPESEQVKMTAWLKETQAMSYDVKHEFRDDWVSCYLKKDYRSMKLYM